MLCGDFSSFVDPFKKDHEIHESFWYMCCLSYQNVISIVDHQISSNDDDNIRVGMG
jgi:hypothetical protein